ncbi:lysosomal Pro-X carboxypeptidase [Lycorma delicatula]|uniref:lysosomal Pro-X carboxypeptidase n=1 Tax=Lycorma delicatula TaxID=130591 RepID=UPI003F50DBD0
MWFNNLFLILFIIVDVFLCYTSTRKHGFLHSKRFRSLSSSSPLKQYKYQTKYIEVPVDHFNFANQDVFKLRYLINDDYWVPESGTPIFFYAGNEGDITLFAENTGFMWEIAQEFKALVVFAEHRYYGETLPYGNKSYSDPEHYGYLTAEQALADYVDLITYLRSHQDGVQRKISPVIVFGGSYGGMLAAWFRIKYPAVVAGALAASAPIWQFTGLTKCEAFNQVTTSAYEKAAKNCPQNIRQTWKEINNLAKTDEGRSWLSKNWTLCQPVKNETDVSNLKMWLVETMIDVAMANYPYPANFLGELPGYPVKEFCQHIKTANLKGKELLGSVSNGLKIWYNYTGEAKCLDWSTEETTSLGYQGWDFQACSQMIMPMCSNGVNDMFELDKWNLTEYVTNCEEDYKIKPKPYFIIKQYGGKHLEASSNIIFSNGLLDPWSSGGVLRNVSKTSVAVIIPEGAHHLDLRESNKLDPPSVQVARKYYKQVFRQWITEFRETH